MTEQKIFYKVVDAESRRSSNWMLIKKWSIRYSQLVHPPKGYRKFFPMYSVGKKVKALPGTEGLFLFTTLDSAHDLIDRCMLYVHQFLIIRVQTLDPINEHPRHFFSCGSCLDNLKLFLENDRATRYYPVKNENIVTCQSVRVLT